MQTMAEFMEQKKKGLIAKMGERSALPDKCPMCGYYPCACRCPKCEKCGGTGYIRRNPNASVSDKDYGKFDQCPNYSHHVLKMAIQEGREMGGLYPDEVQKLGWNMVKAGYSDGIKARDAVRKAFEHGSGNVLLFGNFGQAKTLTMKIAVAEALRAGKRARYAKLTNILDDIRLAYDERESKMTALLERIEKWRELDVLALDEMDKAAKDSDWASDRLFNLIDDRYTLAVRGTALTIMAGNWMALSELDGPMGYLRSRIEDNRFAAFGSVVYLNGADGRKVMPEGHRY